MTKICSKCNEEKDLDDFPKKNGKPRSRCKACHAHYIRERYHSNPQAAESQKGSSRKYKKKLRGETDHLICGICKRRARTTEGLEAHLKKHEVRIFAPPYKKAGGNRPSLKEYQKKKAEFLGMDPGTASSKLQKKILFMLVEECGRNSCFRCGLEMSEANLSIEHKKEWLWEDPALFWDLDNISFSHKSCNCKAARKTNKKIESPEGMSWCSGCQDHLPIDEFPPSHFEIKPGKKKNRQCTSCNNKRSLKAKHVQFFTDEEN